MAVIPISDLSDSRLDVYRELKQTNHTRWQQIFIAEGEKLVERLLDSSFETLSVLSADSHVERIAARVSSAVPVYQLPAALIDQLIGFNFHRGILACGRRPKNPPVESLWTSNDQPLTLVLCPDIKDPENLGTILRISAAFGVHGIIVGEAGTDPYSRRVLRVSMGTVFRLPIVQTDDWAGTLATLRQSGIETAATVLDTSAEQLISARRPLRFALALGCEGHGLSPDFVAQCDRKLTIPMADGVDSLNVSIAAGIFLHHFTTGDRSERIQRGDRHGLL